MFDQAQQARATAENGVIDLISEQSLLDNKLSDIEKLFGRR